MEIRRLPATEAAVERYAAALWLPYHRDLAAFVSTSVDECPAVFDRPDRLGVDVDNERATAFYEKAGFEPYRKQLTRDVECGGL